MSRRSRDHADERAAAGREPPPARRSPDGLRRLGPLEYLLLSLIALSIAITLAMALLNP